MLFSFIGDLSAEARRAWAEAVAALVRIALIDAVAFAERMDIGAGFEIVEGALIGLEAARGIVPVVGDFHEGELNDAAIPAEAAVGFALQDEVWSCFGAWERGMGKSS